MVELEYRDIIQIDATIITGVLILLSISLGLPETPGYGSGLVGSAKIVAVYLEVFKAIIILSIIIPFSLSAGWVIEDYLSAKPPRSHAVRAMKLGFFYIMAGVVAIVILQLMSKFFFENLAR